MQALDERALMVGLIAANVSAEISRPLGHHRLDLIQGRCAVDVGLTPAEQVEVCAVQHQDPHHGDTPPLDNPATHVRSAASSISSETSCTLHRPGVSRSTKRTTPSRDFLSAFIAPSSSSGPSLSRYCARSARHSGAPAPTAASTASVR